MTDEHEFTQVFTAVFEHEHAGLLRYLGRLTGDSVHAADLAQETFVRLFERGSLPENVPAWLVTVAHNLFRDEHRRSTRRLRLLERNAASEPAFADPEVDAGMLDAEHERTRVRRALDAISERDRRLLLLRDEGQSYRDLASALGLQESSVGTLLARAKVAFRVAYEGGTRASV